jgi:anti-sigma factor (TIGR02949 family)
MRKPPRKKARVSPRKAPARKGLMSLCGGMSAAECEKALEHIYEFINSCDLKADLGAEIKRHLDSCRGCFTRFEFEQKLVARLKEAGCCSCPETLKARVLTILKEF